MSCSLAPTREAVRTPVGRDEGAADFLQALPPLVAWHVHAHAFVKYFKPGFFCLSYVGPEVSSSASMHVNVCSFHVRGNNIGSICLSTSLHVLQYESGLLKGYKRALRERERGRERAPQEIQEGNAWGAGGGHQS